MKNRLHAAGLRILGAVHEAGSTIYLVGPDGPAFWNIFCASPEFRDGRPDPIDRYSTRILNDIAIATDSEALFPFGGPPYLPFFQWAVDSGRCFQSPIHLLIHSELGLFASFRGALKFDGTLLIPAPAAPPCESCLEKPCLAACPVQALTKSNYDVAACHVFLDSEPGAACMTRGCAVRRACPIGQNERLAAQSAFHMKSFHKGAAK